MLRAVCEVCGCDETSDVCVRDINLLLALECIEEKNRGGSWPTHTCKAVQLYGSRGFSPRELN